MRIVVLIVTCLSFVVGQAIINGAHEKLSLKLATNVALAHAQTNVVISPLLLHAALTLLYDGSADETTKALAHLLDLESFSSKQNAIKSITDLLKETKLNTEKNFYTANAFYIQEHFTYNYKSDFLQQAAAFDINLERLKLGKNEHKALDQINCWVLANTNYTISEIFQAYMLSNDHLQLMLISAAAFKAPWAQAFDVKDTEKLSFYTSRHNFKAVDNMFIEHKFNYAEFAHLDAKAIELPFQAAGLKMLIIYPNQIDGLQVLEEKLKRESLARLSQQMSEHRIALTMPKFRVEFNADLKSLFNLGVSNIFHSKANFKNMFHSLPFTDTPPVTRIQHKAMLEIDESGASNTEGFSLQNLLSHKQQLFINHPFFYVITSNEAIILAGHIVNI